MSKKMYLHLLIFCGIFCQGLIATLSNEDTRESSNFLVRKRRVINHLPGGSVMQRIELSNYHVIIKENNRAHCSGAILSRYTVITAELCVRLHVSSYRVLSGSGIDRSSNPHNVISKAVYFGTPPHDIFSGIALIIVDPLFVYSSKTENIPLFVGHISEGTMVTVSGCGVGYPLQPGPPVRRGMRRITLPIMNHAECQDVYQYRYNITDKYICTYDERQYCARTDAGAPLVVNNMLAGIHVYKGEFSGQINPDVYINLQRADYREWIRNNHLINY